MKLKRFNESEDSLKIIDLVYLFSELSDEYIKIGDKDSLNRNISIQTGEYFKSRPFLLSDLLSSNDGNYDLKDVLKYLDSKKPFVISIQIVQGKKLEDSLYILNFINDNYSQIEYFGYKLNDFWISKEEDLIQLKYISI